MADAVTVYKWDDVGAPQIVDGKPSEYMNVIKKCLVDGYGIKAAAGWSVAQEDITPYLAVRNNDTGGSGGVFEMSCATNNDAGAYVIVSAHIDFVDSSNKGRSFQKTVISRGLATTSGMLKNWIVLATDTAFLFFVTSDSRLSANGFATNNHISLWCGDLNSFYANDPARFVLISTQNDAMSLHYAHNFAYQIQMKNEDSLSVYALDGQNNRALHSLVSVISNKSIYITLGATIAHDEPEISVLSPFYVNAGANSGADTIADYLNSDTFPRVRATLPGVFCSQQAGFASKPMPHFKTINGQLHFQLPNPHNYLSMIWINCEQW